jgi:hypothetical protein
VRFCVAIVLVASCTAGIHPPYREPVRDCTESYLLPAADGVASAALIAASLIMVKTQAYTDCEALDCMFLPGAIAASIMLPIASAHGFDVVHRCREIKHQRAIDDARERARADAEAERAAADRASLARAASRERAWRMTVQAMEAARAGDCTTTRDLGAHVRDTDEELHKTVFVRDAGIARCLAGP